MSDRKKQWLGFGLFSIFMYGVVSILVDTFGDPFNCSIFQSLAGKCL